MYCGAVEFVCSPAAVRHIPVLLEECLSFLSPEAGGSFADLTFGGGGHSRSILAANPDVSLLAMDCDPDASLRAESVKDEFGERFRFQDASFSKIDQFSAEGEFNGVLMDLGISSFQLDDNSRGFSFQTDSSLDMRMDQSSGLTAYEWLNQAKEKEIADVFFYLGEERKSRSLARQIVENRKIKKISSTSDLSNLYFRNNRSKKHPATNIFRAVRMFINDEIEELISALKSSISLLKKGGRLVVISFHSIEDRIVKNFL